MKYLYTTLILILFTALVMPAARAQNQVDISRMQRDINIMESILEELFRTQWETKDNNTSMAPSGNFFFRSGNDIRGTYLPDYGVIFTIPSGSPSFLSFGDGIDGEGYSYSFRYSDDSAQKEINKENVTQRIREFLREYGSTIGQLDADDRILVIYNSRTPRSASAVFIGNDANTKRQNIPTVSVIARKNDLEAYRSGKIDASELNSRFSVSTAAEDENKRLDLKVMSNIFETALKERDGKTFRVRGSVSHLYLDNFGALFFLDARYAPASGTFIFNMPEIAGIDISDEENRARIKVESVLGDEPNKSGQKPKETAENIKKSYEVFISNLKEYLVDYGRTLSSVTPNQHILLSVTVSSAVDEVPERVDLQIKKSVLEAMDKGDTSRDEAISSIMLREY